MCTGKVLIHCVLHFLYGELHGSVMTCAFCIAVLMEDVVCTDVVENVWKDLALVVLAYDVCRHLTHWQNGPSACPG